MTMDIKPKRRGRRYPIDLVVEHQLEAVEAFLNQQSETDTLSIWQVPERNPNEDEFTVTLRRGGRNSPERARIMLRRWEGIHTRIYGSLEFQDLEIREPGLWLLYLPVVGSVVIALVSQVITLTVPLLQILLSLLALALPLLGFVLVAFLSEYLVTQRLSRLLRDHLLRGLKSGPD